MAKRVFIRQTEPKSKKAIEQSLLRHKLAFTGAVYSGVYDELCPLDEVARTAVLSYEIREPKTIVN